MKLLKKALFFYLILLSYSLNAVEIKDLYEAEVVAAYEQDKSEAIQGALKIVLNRILAGDNVFEDVTVQTVLSNAEYYVNEYQYSLSSLGAEQHSRQRLMRVQFNEHLLINILRPGLVGLWNEVRPNTLVWLVIDTQGQQVFFDAEAMPEIDRAIKKAAKIKGVPVLIPIDDLQEKQSLSPGDVLSAYSDYLLSMSERYDVVSTLAGKLIDEGTCWRADWTFYFDNKIRQWRSPCQSIQEVMLSGFQSVYQGLAVYYSVKPEKSAVDSVLLKVSDIENDSELVLVQQYLDSLAMIKTVTWIGLDAKENIYRIFYQGSRQVLNEQFRKDQVLRIKDYSLVNQDAVEYQFLAK